MAARWTSAVVVRKVGAMFHRCIWLAVTVSSVAFAVALPKGSAKRELQRLVRLPMLEFGTPLEFHRRLGFVVFPDKNTAVPEAALVLKEAMGRTEDARLHLKAAGVFDAQGDATGAMRQYAKAIDLYRKLLEISPEEETALAGLGEALTALGRFSEAQAVLEQAGNSNGNLALALAQARLYRERAWFAAAGEAQRYATASFMDQLAGLVRKGPDAARLEDSKRYIKLAEEALNRAFQTEATEALKVERLRERAGVPISRQRVGDGAGTKPERGAEEPCTAREHFHWASTARHGGSSGVEQGPWVDRSFCIRSLGRSEAAGELVIERREQWC